MLQQTSVPSVSVRAGDLARLEDEAHFLDPSWQHQQAYAIYLALADDFGARSDSVGSMTVRLARGSAPAATAALWLDGFPQIADANGMARFSGLDSRSMHWLQVDWGTGTFGQAWIDPAQGRSWEWDSSQPGPRPR